MDCIDFYGIYQVFTLPKCLKILRLRLLPPSKRVDWFSAVHKQAAEVGTRENGTHHINTCLVLHYGIFCVCSSVSHIWKMYFACEHGGKTTNESTQSTKTNNHVPCIRQFVEQPYAGIVVIVAKENVSKAMMPKAPLEWTECHSNEKHRVK